MTDADDICWFVARTRRGQELAIRERLEAFGIQNFIPVSQTLRIRNGRKVKAVVPLIPNMVFLRTTKSNACALANGHGLQVFYMVDHITNRMLVVPDRQMDCFIRVITGSPDVEVTAFTPTQGQRVRIVSGKLAGVEGEVLSADQSDCIVVSVGTLLSARVKVRKGGLEPIL